MVSNIRAVAARYPVLSYYILAFVISWTGVLLIIGGPGGIPGVSAQNDARLPLVLLAMVAGPSLASVLLTAVLDGRAGLRDLLLRCVRWRMRPRWYAIALVAAPAIAGAVFLVLSVFSARFVPAIVRADSRTMLLLAGMAVASIAGFFEELGWTGFAIPRLRLRFGVFTTGLIVGVLWGAWHLLAIAWGVGDRLGSVPLAAFALLDCLSWMPPFRILMVWVYDRTSSVLVAMLMHVSLTTTTFTLWPSVGGWSLIEADLAVSGALWIVIAAFAVAARREPSPQPEAVS